MVEESGVKRFASGRGSTGGRRLAPYIFFLVTLASIAALQLFTAPSLVAALVAPGIGKHLSEPLRGAAVAQSYFIPSVAAINLALIVYMLHQPVADLRQRLLLGTLVAVTFVVLAVLFLDKAPITTEEAKLTHFTGAALLIASLCAAANVLLTRNTMSFLMWGAIAAALAFAALDEVFELHEQIGNSLKSYLGQETAAGEQPAGVPAQDFVTLLYSASALAAMATLYFVFRRRATERMRHVDIFLAAALIYFFSTILDTFDFALAPLSSTVDALYLAAVLEEILEFVAASLFFVACATALLEGGGQPRLNSIQDFVEPRLMLPRFARAAARGVTYVALALFAAGAVALPLRFPARAALVTENTQHSVQLFAHSGEDRLLHPDGIAHANGRLYVANDVPPSVVAMSAGISRTLASADDLGTPETVEVAGDGTVYLTDGPQRLLLRIAQGAGPQTVLGPRELVEPKGIAFDPKGALYVVDHGAARILVLRGNKAERYAAVPQFKPEEIAFDPSGNLYFTQARPARVIRIAPGGQLSTFVDERAGLVDIEDIAIRGRDIYVADSRRAAIFKFAPDGQGRVIVAFDKRIGAEIEGITVAENGVVYVGFRKTERRTFGMWTVSFIMCIADAARVKARC